jgi:uncharacterized phosphosugar-binding protein
MMTSHDYFSALREILQRIETEQTHAIERAGEMISNSLACGGVLHTFGTGHSHMIAEEVFYRAGGLAPVNVILDERLAFFMGATESTLAERESGYIKSIFDRENTRSGDVAIVISNSGRNAAPLEMTFEFQNKGVKVIAITSVNQSMRSTSRHSSGKRLFEVADLTIDNCVPEGDAVLDIPGSHSKIGPSSTVACTSIINAVIVETAAFLQKLNQPVPVFQSSNVESASDALLEEMLAQWSDRVRLFRTQSASS